MKCQTNQRSGIWIRPNQSNCQKPTGDGSEVEAENVRENTTSGEAERTDAKPAGADTSPEPPNSHKDADAATGRTTPKRRMGTKRERLPMLQNEITNCQTVGIVVKVGRSQTRPHRILIAVYDATLCPKCNGFLAIDGAGMVICQTRGCELEGVEYMPDELPERLAYDKGAK